MAKFIMQDGKRVLVAATSVGTLPKPATKPAKQKAANKETK